MALKNVQRVTFSLPKTTFLKLEINIPKSKRSKFLADLIEKNITSKEVVTYEEVDAFWTNLAQKCPNKTNKTAVELLREDRASH